VNVPFYDLILNIGLLVFLKLRQYLFLFLFYTLPKLKGLIDSNLGLFFESGTSVISCVISPFDFMAVRVIAMNLLYLEYPDSLNMVQQLFLGLDFTLCLRVPLAQASSMRS